MLNNKIVYVVANNLYINLTNRCTNKCEFCVRYYDQPTYGDLWIKQEPTAQQIIEILNNEYDLNDYRQIVFCGYGEPTIKFDEIIAVATYCKQNGKTTRINTNGHGSEIAGRDITKQMVGLIDIVNVSLNATDSIKYDNICHSQYGQRAFDIMLNFAKKCVDCGIQTYLSVVDCIGKDEIAKAQTIADSIGAKLKVRELL